MSDAWKVDFIGKDTAMVVGAAADGTEVSGRGGVYDGEWWIECHDTEKRRNAGPAGRGKPGAAVARRLTRALARIHDLPAPDTRHTNERDQIQ